MEEFSSKSKISNWIKQVIGPHQIPSIIHQFYELSIFAAAIVHRFPLISKNCVGRSPFFIIGSGRSGNTLLRAILSTHPEISIPPESYVLGRVIRLYKFYSFLPWHLLTRLVIGEFESWPQFKTWEINTRDFFQVALNLPANERNLARLLDLFYLYYADQKSPGATRWGDKTPANTFNVNLINQVFPDAMYIHMIRDGRDVVASYLKSGIYKNSKDAAIRWLRSVEIASKFGAKIGPSRYLEITYENIVRQPELNVRNICRFLKIDYLSTMLNFNEKIDLLGDISLPHHANIGNPINSKSIGKWKNNLSFRDQQLVRSLLRNKLAELNYLVD